MSMRDLENFLAQSDEGDFSGQVDESEILAAEEAIGVKFPPTYRKFIKELGAGDLNAQEFYGVIPGRSIVDSPIVPSVGVTLTERVDVALPQSLIIVGDTDMGEWYVLDSGGIVPGEEYPVKIWSRGYEDFVEGEEYEDFGSFAWEMIQEYEE